MQKALHTSRLDIRPYLEEDLGAILEMQHLPSFRAAFQEPAFSREHMLSLIHKVQGYYVYNLEKQLKRLNLIVCHRNQSQAIGWVGIGPFELEAGAFEIYYAIHPDEQGNGYATEASKELIHYAFETFDLKYLLASVDPENLASKRVLEKLGFEFEKKLSGYTAELADFNGELFYRLKTL